MDSDTIQNPPQFVHGTTSIDFQDAIMGKVIIYQIFTRLYGNRNKRRKPNGTLAENGCGKLSFFDKDVLAHIRQLGATHVWYTGVIRHAKKTDYSSYAIPRQHPAVVKGEAGSPYAIADYYDIDPDLANDVPDRMKEFEKLVRRTHDADLKVIIDFVPNHVARQYKSVAKPAAVADLGEQDNKNHGFDPQNNFYYCPGESFQPSFDLYDGQPEAYHEYPAKATGNDHFDSHPGRNDWYETVKLNYGVDYYAGHTGHFSPIPATWIQMLDIVLFWASKKIDGVRCDMAEMVPVEFWSWMTRKVKAKYPHFVFIGEVYNPAEYRNYIAAGFDYLYDKVGMYDTMRAVTCGYSPAKFITGAWQAIDDIRDNMLYFLENHDEQRIASDFFAGAGRKGIPALVASVLMRNNPFMLYAGEEYGERGMDAEGFSGQDGRTTIFDYWSIDTLCRADENRLTNEEKKLYSTYRKVLNLANQEKAVSQGLTFDLMYANLDPTCFDSSRQYAFLRKADNELLLVVVNFCDQASKVSVNLPSHAFEYLSFSEQTVVATDLLSDERQTVNLAKDKAVDMTIAAYGAKVWKMVLAYE